MKTVYWLWYPGDFEIYHALLQNFDRIERGFEWPAFWYQYDCRKQVCFIRSYHLESETTFTVFTDAKGYVAINGKKHPFRTELTCGPGNVKIEIYAGKITGVPAIYIKGEAIFSDTNWMVDDLASPAVPVGYSPYYIRKDQNPSIWEYTSEIVEPQTIIEKENGILYDFGRELTAVVLPVYSNEFHPYLLAYGESEAEALDYENCYYSEKIESENQSIPKHAFRYLFLVNVKADEVHVTARHEFVDIPVRASFSCEDEQLNRIWQVCCETYRLCSGIFFLDGVKRDRWIWSGDAYQSYLVNPYLFFDNEITKRTIWGLRGNDPVRQQINTILDYSMYWIMSIENYYKISGDEEFVRMIWPKMVTMMEFLDSQLDEHGFIIGRSGDWIFIDWSEMDKVGALCAEQMLLVMCYRTMATVQKLIEGVNKSDTQNESERKAEEKTTTKLEKATNNQPDYAQKEKLLKEQIEKFFWDEEKKAYIDSFSSGKRHVTRHANLFAILFDIADKVRCEQIYESVIANNVITQITTPYFKFYELEALCKLGKKAEVLQRMKSYWGAILDEGAATIWEAYDPNETGKEKYAMYDDPYGKSFCHAWGASPIYLLGRYFLGVESTDIGYKTFRVSPDTDLLGIFDCVVPVAQGSVHLFFDGQVLLVSADCDGGILVYGGKEYELVVGKTVTVKKK